MKIQRKASAVWAGGLRDGRGAISTGSGAIKDQVYGFSSRFEGQPGTNPEELIAAAHSGCFSMALSHALSEAGFTPKRVHTIANVHPRKAGRRLRHSADRSRNRSPRCQASTTTRSSRSPRRPRRIVPSRKSCRRRRSRSTRSSSSSASRPTRRRVADDRSSSRCSRRARACSSPVVSTTRRARRRSPRRSRPELRYPTLLQTTYRRDATHFAAALLDVPEDDRRRGVT